MDLHLFADGHKIFHSHSCQLVISYASKNIFFVVSNSTGTVSSFSWITLL